MAEADKVPVAPAETPGDETDWAALAEMDPTIASMLRSGSAMTRSNYLDSKYNGAPPEEWNEDLEMDMPPGLAEG